MPGRAFIFAVALVATPLFASQPPEPAKQPPPPPAPRKLVFRPWMLPPYLLLGLPRDILDAPSKALSSIPLFNKVFMAPLMLLNTLTTSLSWSFTEEGTEGGYAAWVECLGLARKPKALPHKRIPVHMRYGPNWRTFGIIYWEAPPAQPKPAEHPPSMRSPR